MKTVKTFEEFKLKPSKRFSNDYRKPIIFGFLKNIKNDLTKILTGVVSLMSNGFSLSPITTGFRYPRMNKDKYEPQGIHLFSHIFCFFFRNMHRWDLNIKVLNLYPQNRKRRLLWLIPLIQNRIEIS